jgi:hypothetical protein
MRDKNTPESQSESQLHGKQKEPKKIESAELPAAGVADHSRAVIHAASTAAPEANGEVVAHINAALASVGVKVGGVFDDEGLKVRDTSYSSTSGGVLQQISDLMRGIQAAQDASIPQLQRKVDKMPGFFRDYVESNIKSHGSAPETLHSILTAAIDAHEQAQFLIQNPAALTVWNSLAPELRGTIIAHLEVLNPNMPRAVNAVAHSYLVSIKMAEPD